MRSRLLLWIAIILVPFAGTGRSSTEDGLSLRVAWGTYLGGSEREQPREVIVSADGSVLVGGQTFSPDLPVTEGVVQSEYAGEPAGSGHPGVSGGDCFVARISPDGTAFRFLTYFGGSKQERSVYGMEVDRAGNVIIASATRSPDLPVTEGAAQTTYGGGMSDAFLAKLSPDGKKVLWCTYYGGTKQDWPRGGTAIDAEGNVFLLGSASSPGFATTPVKNGKRGSAGPDVMVVKIAADGSKVLSARRFGGSRGETVMGGRIGGDGRVHLAGHTDSRDMPVTEGAPQREPGARADCWFATLSKDGEELHRMTYLAGDGNEFAEHRPALLPDGSVLLTGVTASTDFPVTSGAFQRDRKGRNDGFCARLSPDGRRFAFCTLIGGGATEFLLMPVVDREGRIWMVGGTSSPDFPVTANALQKTFGGGKQDALLVALSPDGSRLLYATYLGGSGDDLARGVAVDGKGGLIVVGNTDSADFPHVTKGSAQPARGGKADGFVLRLEIE